jgi:hypothetical protein
MSQHNMQIPPNDAPVLASYRRATGRVIGADMHHVCNLKICRYWQWGKCLEFVCRTSLHVHVCTGSACTLLKEVADGTFVCPISGVEGQARALVHYPARCKIRGVERFQDSITWRGRNKTTKPHAHRAAKHPVNTAIVRGMVHTIVKSTNHLQDTLDRVASSIGHADSFQHTMTAFICAYDGHDEGDLLPPLPLCRAVAEYVGTVRPLLTPTPSVLILVAVVMSFLQVGLVSKQVTVFPLEPWMARNAPTLNKYSAVAGIQCRSMSTCTRALKRAMFKGGAISGQFVFRKMPD